MLVHTPLQPGGAERNPAVTAGSFPGLADISMVPFTIKLSIGQHQSDGRHLVRRPHQQRQVGTVVPGAGASGLGQDDLSIYIHSHQPFQPVSPGKRLPGVMVQAPHKEGADRALRQTGRIHSHSGTPRRRAASPSAWLIFCSSSRFRKRYKVV